MRIIVSLFLAILLVGCAAEPEPVKQVQEIEEPVAPEPVKQYKIVAYGDSLTAGLGVAPQDNYPSQLQEALRTKGYDVEIINAGISGETSSGARTRIDWIAQTNPDMIILVTGANDGFRAIEPSIIKDNIETIIVAFQNRNVTVVLGGMVMMENLGQDYVDQFLSLYPDLAEEYNVAYIPSFLEGVVGVADLNQADQIHPKKEGYTHIVENNVLPVVEPLLTS